MKSPALIALGILLSASLHAQRSARLLHLGGSDGPHSPYHLAIDGDPATAWSSPAHAFGHGTCLSLILEKEERIEGIQVDVPDGGNVQMLEVIFDHQVLVTLEPGQRLDIARQVRRIDLRVSEENFSASHTAFTGTGLADMTIKRAPRQVALSELHLFVPGQAKALRLEPTPSVPGKVFASSVEEPATHFHPAFLFDGRPAFGWATDHGKQGAGESIALSFDKEVRIERVRLMDAHPGITSVSRLSIRAGDKPAVAVAFPEERLWEGSFLDMAREKPEMQFGNAIRLPGKWRESAFFNPQVGNTFVIQIEAVDPGSQAKLLQIQEMEFFNGKEWFRLAPDQDLLQGEFVRAKTKGMAIGQQLDRAVTWRRRLIDDDLKQIPADPATIAFRTDGSVLFRTDDFGDRAPGSWWFEGAWHHLSPQGGASRVVIEGVMHPIGDNASNARPTKIADTIRIDSAHILYPARFGSTLRGISGATLVPCQLLETGVIDLRYKTPENFMEEQLYPDCMPCLLRDTVLEALRRVQYLLDRDHPDAHYRLLIWDAWRPHDVQLKMWEKVPDTNYVANPHAGGSSHNKGVAIDLTLTQDGATSIDMGTAYDHFGPEAHHGQKKGVSKVARANRLILRKAMEEAGFKALETEWWHYRWPGDWDILRHKVVCE